MIEKNFNVNGLLDSITIVRKVIDLYQGGMSLEKISIQEGLTKHTVIQILKENNVELRRRGR